MTVKKSVRNSSQASMLLRVSRIHFAFVAAYMGAIITFDSWNLITHESVARRWTAAGILLLISTLTWYAARRKLSAPALGFWLSSLVLADIIFSALNVYWERGMASRSVALFAVPIITAAVSKSRSTLLAATTISFAAYSVAAVRYFNEYYGEGYRVELYGVVGFYGALFYILAWLLIALSHPPKDT